MIIAETYRQLITDWPHWAMELTVEAITGILVFPLGRYLAARWVARHDQRVHAKEQ